jgi:hypothetical protein
MKANKLVGDERLQLMPEGVTETVSSSANNA